MSPSPVRLLNDYYYIVRAYRRLRKLYLKCRKGERPLLLREIYALRRTLQRLRAGVEPHSPNWPDTVPVPKHVLAAREKVAPDGAPTIPYPPGCRLYPWYELQVGDSVLIPKTKCVVRKELAQFTRSVGGIPLFFLASDPRKGTWVWRTA